MPEAACAQFMDVFDARYGGGDAAHVLQFRRRDALIGKFFQARPYDAPGGFQQHGGDENRRDGVQIGDVRPEMAGGRDDGDGNGRYGVGPLVPGTCDEGG